MYKVVFDGTSYFVVGDNMSDYNFVNSEDELFDDNDVIVIQDFGDEERADDYATELNNEMNGTNY